MRANCWEVMKCGREPGGKRVKELGVCKTPMSDTFDGSNRGIQGGRACWRIAGSLNGGPVDCTYKPADNTCLNCGFFKRVKYEEGGNFRA